MFLRNPRLQLLLSLIVVLAASFGDNASQAQNDSTTLRLALPDTTDWPDRNRLSTLTIDGKDHTKRGETKREIAVVPQTGKKAVTIVYTFWPTSYEKIIRTRAVAVEAGKTLDVDLTKVDPKQPDRVEPIFYPTPHEVVKRMMEMGQVGPKDVVFDLGCGDGRLVIHAVKEFKAKRGVGLDIDADLVKLCRKNAEADGVGKQVEFRQQDVLKVEDYSEASVVVLYVGDELGGRLSPILRKSLKPGARIVSHRFKLGDWTPDKTIQIKCKNNDGDQEEYTLHLWTVKEAGK